MERLVAWYRVSSSVGAVAALIVANAVPLLGVLFFGWSVWTILILYWLENGIVGAFNVLKMLLAEGGDSSGATGWRVNGRSAAGMEKVALVPFFIVHYGIFWVVHGVFVFALPAFGLMRGTSFLDGGIEVGTIPPEIGALDPSVGVLGTAGPNPWTIFVAVLILLISHGLSFLLNFIGAGEYKRVSAAGQMFAPYGRLVVLHLTIIFGAFAISFLGAPVAAVVILVVLKTLMDLGFHLAEHRKVAPAAIRD